MEHSAFKKFEQTVVIQGPTAPGQITTGSVVDGAVTINYSKVGDLYFNIYVTSGGNNYLMGSAFGTEQGDSVARFCTLMGLGLLASYGGNRYSNVNTPTFYWNGAGWNVCTFVANTMGIVEGILAS